MRNYWEKHKYREYNADVLRKLTDAWWDYGCFDYPWWMERWWFKDSNPSSVVRKKWRREARVKQNRALRLCRDLEELIIEDRISRITNINDWY